MPMEKKTRQEQIKEITDKLEQGIKELYESDRYRDYLNTLSRFHNYSVNNSLLIAMQKPDATYVAGFTSWQRNFERSVIKGEKGIRIIAPSPYKVKQEVEKVDAGGRAVLDADGKPVKEVQEIVIPAYKITTVFDVSQTEGKELPRISDELVGDVQEYDRFLEAVRSVSPVPISFEPIGNGANGYYHLSEKRIAIRDGMSQMQNLKTAIHEVSHALLHDKENGIKKDNLPDRMTKEVQAESVAYTVCQHFGIDTSDYSFGYVAGWSRGRELEELKSSLDTIRSCASDIINGIENHFKAIKKEQARIETESKKESKAETVQRKQGCGRSR